MLRSVSARQVVGSNPFADGSEPWLGRRRWVVFRVATGSVFFPRPCYTAKKLVPFAYLFPCGPRVCVYVCRCVRRVCVLYLLACRSRRRRHVGRFVDLFCSLSEIRWSFLVVQESSCRPARAFLYCSRRFVENCSLALLRTDLSCVVVMKRFRLPPLLGFFYRTPSLQVLPLASF